MKKILAIIVIALVMISILYITKPAEKKLEKSEVVSFAREKEPDQQTAKQSPSKKIVSLKENGRCLGESYLKRLAEQEQKALEDQLAELESEGIAREDLYRIASKSLKSANLAKPYKLKKKKQPFDIAAMFKNKEQKAIIEKILMASYVGNTKKIIAEFESGDLGPLKPKDDQHRLFVANTFLLNVNSNNDQIINELYDKDGDLPLGLFNSAIMSSGNTKELEKELSRFGGIKQMNALREQIYAENGYSPVTALLIREHYENLNYLLDNGLAIKDTEQANSAIDNLSEKVPADLINKLLDKGFRASSEKEASKLAEKFSKKQPALAERFSQQAMALAEKERDYVNKLPKEIQSLLETAKQKKLNLAKQQNICKEQKKTIPDYAEVDKKFIDKEVAKMLADELESRAIINSFSAMNKESIEYAYSAIKDEKIKITIKKSDEYREKLKKQKKPESTKTEAEVIGKEWAKKTLIVQDENWPELVNLITKQVKEGKPTGANYYLKRMLDGSADDFYVQQVAALANKNDHAILSINRKPEISRIKKLRDLGFNINLKNNDNKNLFYSAVKFEDAEILPELVDLGIKMESDPYGYDPLDHVLRQKPFNFSLLAALVELEFPITDDHLDYALYIKTYYPEGYQKLIEVMPEMIVKGQWQNNNKVQ